MLKRGPFKIFTTVISTIIVTVTILRLLETQGYLSLWWAVIFPLGHVIIEFTNVSKACGFGVLAGAAWAIMSAVTVEPADIGSPLSDKAIIVQIPQLLYVITCTYFSMVECMWSGKLTRFHMSEEDRIKLAPFFGIITFGATFFISGWIYLNWEWALWKIAILSMFMISVVMVMLGFVRVILIGLQQDASTGVIVAITLGVFELAREVSKMIVWDVFTFQLFPVINSLTILFAYYNHTHENSVLPLTTPSLSVSTRPTHLLFTGISYLTVRVFICTYLGLDTGCVMENFAPVLASIGFCCIIEYFKFKHKRLFYAFCTIGIYCLYVYFRQTPHVEQNALNMICCFCFVYACF